MQLRFLVLIALYLILPLVVVVWAFEVDAFDVQSHRNHDNEDEVNY
jgi:hypothetical protein